MLGPVSVLITSDVSNGVPEADKPIDLEAIDQMVEAVHSVPVLVTDPPSADP